MQTLVETLNRYNNAFGALCEAQYLVRQLETEAHRILGNNTESITVPVSGGAVHKITTPDSLRDLIDGTVITIGGAEYMRTGHTHGPWVDFLGNKRSHDYLFRHMLGHVGECMIVHEGN